MEERELNEKITSINVILNDLKAQKESRRHKKNYTMKNLIIDERFKR